MLYFNNGDLGAIRTLDLLLRRQLLYPAELRGHNRHYTTIYLKGQGKNIPITPMLIKIKLIHLKGVFIKQNRIIPNDIKDKEKAEKLL